MFEKNINIQDQNKKIITVMNMAINYCESLNMSDLVKITLYNVWNFTTISTSDIYNMD